MTLTHRDLAEIIAGQYGNVPGIAPPTWLYLSNPDANVYMGITRRERCLIISTRGSFDLVDWWHDLEALPVIPRGRPELKTVHSGMYGGTPEAWDIVDSAVMGEDLLVFIGHSLGAARAGLLAGHAIANGIDPKRVSIVCWGEPRWCTEGTRALLAGATGTSYRNAGADGHDKVTDVPGLEFGQHISLTDIDGGARGIGLDPFRRHHFDLYLPATPPEPVLFRTSVAGG